MRKIFVLVFFILLLCLAFSGCSDTSRNGLANSTTKNITESTTSTIIQDVVEPTVTTIEAADSTDATKEQTQSSPTDNTVTTTTVTTQKNEGNSLISDENIEKIENSNAEVFFTDNPNNKHIVAVSQKYGAKKENLVALIKVNAEFPSATVLEFSGKRGANGELVMTYAELENVYDINEETNTIVKASKSGFDNDGLTFVEAKVYVMLAKEYFIPELPNLKENKRYQG